MTRVCPPLGLVAAALAAACSSSTQAPHGAPMLLDVFWSAGGSRYVIWSPPATPDAQQVSSVPPLASEIDFVFNRRLDGSRIEDTVVDGGVTVEQPKAVPPITVAGFDPQAASPPFVLDVLYNSVGLFGDGTSYVLARPRLPGLPSATSLTFQLDRSNLTSPYDEPLGMPDSVPIATQAFSVTIKLPAGSDGGPPVVPGGFQLPLAFSNRVAAPARAQAFVHVRAGGVDVPFDLLVDPLDSGTLRLVAGSCLGAWPAGANLDVTVDAGLPDAFGVGLTAGATATFATAPGAGPSLSACASPDGGAAD